MNSTKSVCNFNCVCNNSDCSFRHYINFKERKVAAKIIATNQEYKTYQEENNINRRANCIYGQMCRNKNCNFKHQLNPDGRFKFIEEYETAIATSILSKSTEKKIKVIVPKVNNIKITNLFMTLPDDNDNEEKEEIPEIIEEVILKTPKIKWSDIVKLPPKEVTNDENDEVKEIKNMDLFEKMIKTEGKTLWADYDSEDDAWIE